MPRTATHRLNTRTNRLLAALFGVISSLACDREPAKAPPAGAPEQLLADGADDGASEHTVKGNAPNSDPATDQSVLARTVPGGGASGSDALNPRSGGAAGAAGVGGLIGAKPVWN